jgi:signal peptidase I
VESIVIAIVLAFLFRAFLAEAFVIPTGSMAPTLQGRHKDIKCDECGYRYRVGDSEDEEAREGQVLTTTCPICFHREAMNPLDAGHISHTGDRILVNKFAYEDPFGRPKRWDVIVFKFPGNAKQNYIKRLIGLPGETIWIRHGDIFVQPSGTQEAAIARKPPDKLRHMLQLVHDTDYASPKLVQVGWPLPWQSPEGQTGWSSSNDGRSFQCEAQDQPATLRYHHYLLDVDTRDRIEVAARDGESLPSTVKPQPILITDFYAYNADTRSRSRYGAGLDYPSSMGLNWVGDLALECELEVLSDTGELELDLVEAGRHHRCRIDLASGTATMSIDGGQMKFLKDDQQEIDGVTEVTAATSIRGKGAYSLRFSNVDDQLLLWVNGTVCTFDHVTTYQSPDNERPATSSTDPGDLAPIGLTARAAQLRVNRLRVLRDIYYIATKSEWSPTDYQVADPRIICQVLKDPTTWTSTRNNLFDLRQEADFPLEEDQFFPLGDNSPYSRDGRLWGRDVRFVNGRNEAGAPIHHVDRDLLIGKAVLIYWPHPWCVRVPLINRMIWAFPNFQRMGLIH